jgi:glycosyltransferase involved in cell wall biosynthesis
LASSCAAASRTDGDPIVARICIDGFNLGMAKGSGIATYARNLLSVVSELGHETQILFASQRGRHPDNLMNMVDLVDAPEREDRFNPMRALRRSIPPGRPIAWPVDGATSVITRDVETRFPPADRLWARRDIFHSANRAHASFQIFTSLRLGRELQTDLVHWTCLLPLYEPRTRNVYTIHDLVPLRLPFSTLDNKRNFYELCQQVSRRADRIITVSEHSKRDIVRILNIPESRVFNTYQAVELPASVLTPTDEEVAQLLEAALSLSWKGYYLFFGAIEPKKNIARIVEAYLSSGSQCPLVIVGGRAWLEEEQKDLLYEELIEASVLKDGVLRRSDRVRQYDYLPFRLLVSLIRGARATLFPSLYEGFGLPVLESMLLGTPVLTSAEGSLPEIAGDAAMIVDAYDSHSIRRGIQALDADEGLRTALTERGRAQAAKFSRQAYLERVQQAYQGLI